MKKIYSDKQLVATMIEKGLLHAQRFTPEKHAADVMKVYQAVL